MRLFRVLMIQFLLVFSSLLAQGTAGYNAKFEYRSLVDLPTAGILDKGFVGVSMDVMPAGVLMSRIEVGVFDNFSFGISYGGGNVIGTGPVEWYSLPGINLRLRIINETETIPAIGIGFDSQGKGAYFDSIERFEIKSPGFFAAAGKNFEFLGFFSLHVIVNYSLEREDSDKDLNLGLGFEKTLGGKVSLVGEYNVALNDNTVQSIGDGSGYLNMGLRWSVGEGFTIGLDLRDLLSNKKINTYKADRGIFVEYIKSIF